MITWPEATAGKRFKKQFAWAEDVQNFNSTGLNKNDHIMLLKSDVDRTTEDTRILILHIWWKCRLALAVEVTAACYYLPSKEPVPGTTQETIPKKIKTCGSH